MIPVNDHEAAKAFYGGTLGLVEVYSDEAATTYRSGNSTLTVYPSEFAGTNKGTAAAWNVPDVEHVVGELAARGVAFEE